MPLVALKCIKLFLKGVEEQSLRLTDFLTKLVSRGQNEFVNVITEK